MRLINIPGSTLWVNPEYVTSVGDYQAHRSVDPSYISVVEFEGNAGYRTRTALSTMPAGQLAALLEHASTELPS
jgi:hypothetical protein